ncbi:MAG: peptidylprolyl isomerase [Bacteroidia bacterium]|nr:peptidylprolyl isomerase [Bacteroidia bacterium]
MKLKFLNNALLVLLFCSTTVFAQQKSQVIDEIISTVGDEIILKSDVETQYMQYLAQGNYANDNVKCFILDQLLLDKLMLHQARIDSVEVTSARVDGELDRRMAFFIGQVGSEEKLEEFYGKSILELKDEFRSLIKDQLLIQSMQGNISGDITVTPSEVRSFYNGIHPDSLPLVNAEVEYVQIVKNVEVSEAQKEDAKKQLRGFKTRLENGEDFGTIAVLYSDDVSSAKNSGEIGFTNRGDLVPEYEAAALELSPGEISDIVETKFGFHLIELLERRGNQINTRHILVKPKVTTLDQQNAINVLDSIADMINAGKLTFAKAAMKFSDDEETKINGGKVVNPATANTKFETDGIDPTVFFQLDKLSVGEISKPALIPTLTGDPSYRLLKLVSRTKPHKANLVEDYQRIQEGALNDKKNRAMQDWVQSKRRSTYIEINDDFKQCSELEYWFN